MVFCVNGVGRESVLSQFEPRYGEQCYTAVDVNQIICMAVHN